ncbi:ras-related protein Rab-6-like [Acropora muricata]|uniref:ras-related protein Rab-6-like n=1 Tax=Acropora muricata TaxID=159855 RepID=UPI0034E495E0
MQSRGSLDSIYQTENVSKFKVVVLGDQGVGKSALVWKFVYNGFEDKYQPTIGIDFFTKTLYLNGIAVRLQIWDTAGQERFRCLIPSYLRDCQIILVCFDLTNCCSLDNVPDWIALGQQERQGRLKKPLIVLVGNKLDDTSRRQISYECANSVAELFQIPYVETSAMSGFNVELLFRKVAKDLYVEDLNRLRQNGDPDICEEDRENRKILRLSMEPKKFMQKTGSSACRCS